MPERERVLDVFMPDAGSGFLSTALIAVRTRMSIETVRETLERLRSQGFVRLHESDPDVWALVASHEGSTTGFMDPASRPAVSQRP
jgi:hypothetical protein